MGICRHYVADESAAEDVLHDAFIIIFTSVKTLKDNAKVEGWMATIVRNLALRYLQGTEISDVPLSYLGSELADDDCQEEKDIELEMLLSAIELLPAGNREVFKLSVLDGLSHKEIGELLGINPHSSSSQLFRAKKMLRAILVNYWMLLLLPILIPLYVYFMTRDESAGTSVEHPTVAKMHRVQMKGVGKREVMAQAKQSEIAIPISAGNRAHASGEPVLVPVETLPAQVKIDTIDAKRSMHPVPVDALPAYVRPSMDRGDAAYRGPQIREDKMLALNNGANPAAEAKRKYPWTFNFGYSEASSGSGMSALNYLSVVDYANGGAAAKIYSWGEYIDYLDRNRVLMDSVENAKLRQLAVDQFISDAHGIGEKVHHHRPQTFGVALNKPLNARWTFGTGLTYTRLKSEFESRFNTATVKKTQKIDYIGIPLRLTYRLWDKGRFNAYATGGVTFEVPVHSSLTKKFTVTADSSFTMKERICPRYQWSVNVGVGIQYQIARPFSLYLEPNLLYYFRNGSGLQTYRTEHPLTFGMPFGLRLTW